VEQHRPVELGAEPVDGERLGGVDREPDLVLAEAAGPHPGGPPDPLQGARPAGVDVEEGDQAVGVDGGLVQGLGARPPLLEGRRAVDGQHDRLAHAVGVLVGEEVLHGAPGVPDVLMEVDHPE
jgi:hypothetical protein